MSVSSGLPWASAGKMGKYAIRTIPIPALVGMRYTWLARVPYGTWQMFTSWEGAAAWLWAEHRAHVAAQGPVRDAGRGRVIEGDALRLTRSETL